MSNDSQLTSGRQLEDLLQDPNTEWSDIRAALKARGQSACTNAALIRAIATETTSAHSRGASSTSTLAPIAKFDVHHLNVHKPENNDDVNSKSAESNDEAYGEYLVLTHPERVSGTEEPVKSKRWPRRRKSSKLIDQSVNMMDFGVDNFAELEDEAQSVVSAESNYTCDSKGFLDWKKSSDDEASLQSNLSGLCEADGFLNWELTASARAKKALTATKLSEIKSSMNSDSTNWSRHCDADGFLGWEMSASIRAAKALEAEMIAKVQDSFSEDAEQDSQLAESWRIEDYEGSNDNECKRSGHRHRKTLSFLSPTNFTPENTNRPFWKNLIHAQTAQVSDDNTAATTNESIELNDVKEALMKRCSRQYENAENITKQSAELHLPTEHFQACTDTREAIWIDTTDGDVDIEKECRKLYLQSEEPQEKQPSVVAKYIRRASLLE